MDIFHSRNCHILKENICLVHSATTHTILKNEKYFTYFQKRSGNVNTISGSTNIIEGSGRAYLLLPGGTKFVIDDALFSPNSQRNLLSFKEIRRNGYHVETINRENKNSFISYASSRVRKVLNNNYPPLLLDYIIQVFVLLK